MARARNIKPGFFSNDALAECSPLARILFAGLWCIADKSGRLEDRPKKIKAEVLPYDDCDADELLSQLEKHGFILRYAVCNFNAIQILNFEKHQNPHVKEAESTIQAPDKNCASPVQEQETHTTNPADSLLPITDSIVTTLSGKPDDMPEPAKNKSAPFTAEAKEVLDYLNSVVGANFAHVESNIKPIVSRIREGATVSTIKAVIDAKNIEWSGDMRKFLRPITLFNASKFASYSGALNVKSSTNDIGGIPRHMMLGYEELQS